MQRTVILLASAMAMASSQAVRAQDQVATGEVALYSEMWALAGVCNQLAGYGVEQEELATFLNDRRDVLDPQDWLSVADGRTERLKAIRDEMERIDALPNGNRRQQAVDENAATLMSRCTRLANSDTAGEFFRRTS